MRTRQALTSLATVAAVLAVATGCASSAQPTITGQQDTYWQTANQPVAGQPWIVGLGDSYISGEAGRWASNGKDNAQYFGDGGWFVGTADQVYGDSPDGTESIPYCHRTATAAMFVGTGWNSKNLACSGAETTSDIGDHNRLKPGIDFVDTLTPWGQMTGQALQLQEFAKDHDVKVVALSIGGNNLGFANIIQTCVEDWLMPFKTSLCSNSEKIDAMVNTVTQQTIGTAIATAIANINTAMTNAGKSPDSWRLVYQLPPSPVPTSDDIQYPDSGFSREFTGGCPMHDADLDWANHVLIPFLYSATQLGVEQAQKANPKIAPITLEDASQALDGHRLCETGTERPSAETGIPPNEFSQSVEWVRMLSLLVAEKYPASENYPEAMHPTFFAQRALAACLQAAINAPRDTPGIACSQPQQADFQTPDPSRPPVQANLVTKVITPDFYKQ